MMLWMSATIACMDVVEGSRDAPPAGDGYLHLFGAHIPALAAMLLTVPLVWGAVELIHRSRRR